MAKKYQIILINKENNKRQMLYNTWTSKKKAIKFGMDFIATFDKPIADFEVVEAK